MRDTFSAPCPIVCGHGHRAPRDETHCSPSTLSPPLQPLAAASLAATFPLQSNRASGGTGLPLLGTCQKPIPMSWALFESIAKRHVKARP